LSLGIGIVLSLLAAFWPAASAAKMPPAAALRTEI
jgi:ABC-type lipoprotein release transport system permease subunit